jgi:hypothetical protein
VRPLLDPPPDTVRRSVRVTALVAAFYVAGVHLGLAEQRYNQAHYVGALFVVGALGLLVGAAIAAGGDSFGRPVVWAAWSLGAIVCVGMFVGFLLSRTVGLPGYHRSDWPPEQVIALALEAVYLVTFGMALRNRRSRR